MIDVQPDSEIGDYFSKNDQKLLAHPKYEAIFSHKLKDVKPDILVYIRYNPASVAATKPYSMANAQGKIDSFSGTFKSLRQKIIDVRDKKLAKEFLKGIEPPFHQKVWNFLLGKKYIWIIITNNDPNPAATALTPHIILHRMGHGLFSSKEKFSKPARSVFDKHFDLLDSLPREYWNLKTIHRPGFVESNAPEEILIELFIQYMKHGRTKLRKNVRYDELTKDQIDRIIRSEDLRTQAVDEAFIEKVNTTVIPILERDLSADFGDLLKMCYGHVFIG